MRWGCAMGRWTLTIAGAHFTLGSLYHVELYRWRRQDEDDPSTATAVPTQPAEETKEGTRTGSRLVRLLQTKAVVATSTSALDVEMPPLGPLGVPGGGYLRTRIYLFETKRAGAVDLSKEQADDTAAVAGAFGEKERKKARMKSTVTVIPFTGEAHTNASTLLLSACAVCMTPRAGLALAGNNITVRACGLHPGKRYRLELVSAANQQFGVVSQPEVAVAVRDSGGSRGGSVSGVSGGSSGVCGCDSKDTVAITFAVPPWGCSAGITMARLFRGR